MPNYTITLTDAQVAAIARCLGKYKSPEAWLKTQVETWARSCAARCRDDDLRAVGVSGLADLTAAELKTITDGRK